MHLNTRGTYKRDLSKVFTYNCMCEEPQLSGVMVGRRKKERTNCVNADSHCAILTLPETASALAKAWRGWEAQKPGLEYRLRLRLRVCTLPQLEFP